MKRLLPLFALFLIHCAQTGSGREPGPESLAQADSIAFAFIPKNIAHYQNYQSFRENPDMLNEIMDLDLGLRENDYAVEELGQPNFAALQILAAGDTVIRPQDFNHLRFGPRRLLLILDVPVQGGPTAKTKYKDALHNTMTVLSYASAAHAGYGTAIKPFQHTQEYGHGFRALLFDQVEQRILFDTTTTIVTDGQKAPGQRTEESYVKYHYRSFVKARVKNRIENGAMK